jgi:flagellar motility protein MotE (MotC chaperone)
VKNVPRILPLIGVAMGGVLAINALAGAKGLPGLVSGAKAFAEEAAKPTKGKKGDKADAKDAAATGDAANASATVPGLMTPASKPPAVCAPTAAELAKEAGLSPAELQVLQNLGERRGQLDQREDDLNTQLALMAAAEAKLDAKVNALNGLKGDIQKLLDASDQREQAEIDRLVKVYEGMKPKDAAPRFQALDDSVRLPIAAKMKDKSLAAILSLMSPADSKAVTEALAKRFQNAKALAANAPNTAQQAANAVPTPPAPGVQPPQQAANAATPPAAAAKKAPAKKAPSKQAKKAAPRKQAPATAQAAAKPAPAAAAATPPAAPAG